jgi:hypothetical protein
MSVDLEGGGGGLCSGGERRFGTARCFRRRFWCGRSGCLLLNDVAWQSFHCRCCHRSLFSTSFCASTFDALGGGRNLVIIRCARRYSDIATKGVKLVGYLPPGFPAPSSIFSCGRVMITIAAPPLTILLCACSHISSSEASALLTPVFGAGA